MSRHPALEANNFAAIRQLLGSNYGDRFASAAIDAVDSGTQSFAYRVTPATGESFYFKLTTPDKTVRAGLPEQFSRYVYQQGIPAVFYETMRDGKVAKRLPEDAKELSLIMPTLSQNEAALKPILGASLSMARTIPGKTLPSRMREPERYQTLFPEMASQVGALAGSIASQTNGFLQTYHLTPNDLPPNQYNAFEERANQLLKALHLDKFGDFETVHHKLHDPSSDASHHLHEHAEIMRHNAQAMLRVAAQRNDVALAESASSLERFANRYEKGYALSMMHRMHQLLKHKDLITARQTHLIHGDFWRENLLEQDEKITGLLDFDRVQKGDKLHDVAKFLSQHPFNPYLVQQTLKGYETGFGAPLDANDLAALPYVMMQRELIDLPSDLNRAFREFLPTSGTDTVLTKKMSDAEIAAFVAKPAQDRKLHKLLFGRMDTLAPYIEADYGKILSEQQFDTSLFRKAGRIHVEGGNSCFDYIGAVFSAKDFLPENATRLKEKLNTVIDNQVRIAQFEAANPTRKDYIIDEVVTAYPSVNISSEERQTRQAALIKDIQGKLGTMSPQAVASEELLLQKIGGLPPLVQEWLYLKGTEFAFTDKNIKGEDGIMRYKDNRDLFPDHPSLKNMRMAGGNFLTFHPSQGEAITYAYASLQRDPMVLLAHEAIGHAIYNQVRQRDPQNAAAITEEATRAIIADCGDVNKTGGANPNTGRLGQLFKAINETKNHAELWNALSAIDPSRMPKLEGKAREEWLSNVCKLTEDTYKKMGPKGWMYTVPMYAERNLFVDELMSATAEQMFITGKGKERELSFVLPALTGFFAGTLLPDMERFVQEKRVKIAPTVPSSSTTPTPEEQFTLADITAKREEAKKLKFIGSIAGIAGGAIATIAIGGAIMATSWATVPVLACMGIASLISFGTAYKTSNDSILLTDSIQAERVTMLKNTSTSPQTLQPEPDLSSAKNQNWAKQVEQERNFIAERAV